MKISNLQPKMNRDEVFRLIDCHEDSPVYEEVEESYESLEEEVYKMIEPAGIFEFSRLTKKTETKEYPAGSPEGGI